MVTCPKCSNKNTLVKTNMEKGKHYTGVLTVPLNNHKLSANEIRYCDKCDTYFNDDIKIIHVQIQPGTDQEIAGFAVEFMQPIINVGIGESCETLHEAYSGLNAKGERCVDVEINMICDFDEDGESKFPTPTDDPNAYEKVEKEIKKNGFTWQIEEVSCEFMAQCFNESQKEHSENWHN